MLEYLPGISDILSELVTGTIAGTVVAGSSLGYRYYQKRKIERKYPVAGEYISFFEDMEQGEKVVVPSKSTVKQKGSTLTIVTELGNGRSWTLDGTIMQGGHISGVYSADAVYDEGVGSFYFNFGETTLDGMWNGYDHINKTTSAGRYWFKRVIEATIRPAERADINEILHTSGNAFGHGYIDRSDIQNSETQFALIAMVDGEFAGYCFGYLERNQSVAEIVKLQPAVLPDDVRFAEERGRLGILKSMVVREKYRGHSIGNQLIKEAEQKLISMKAECILVPAWSLGGKQNIGGLLKLNDYSQWLENTDYWKTDCEARKFECVAYEGTCQCSVIFYRKGRF